MLVAAALLAATVPAEAVPAEGGTIVVTSCTGLRASWTCDDEPVAQPPPESAPPAADHGGDAPPAPPPRLTGAQRPFGWVDDVEAVCITFVQGVTPRKALAVLVPEPGAGPRRPADVWLQAEDQGGDGLSLAGTAGGWTYVWQDNRWSCSTPETVRALRGARRFVSAYWNVEAKTELTVAERGRVVRAVDVVVAEYVVGRPRPSERGLDWGEWRSALLAVIERETGVRITDRDWPLRRAAVAAVEPP